MHKNTTVSLRIDKNTPQLSNYSLLGCLLDGLLCGCSGEGGISAAEKLLLIRPASIDAFQKVSRGIDSLLNILLDDRGRQAIGVEGRWFSHVLVTKPLATPRECGVSSLQAPCNQGTAIHQTSPSCLMAGLRKF